RMGNLCDRYLGDHRDSRSHHRDQFYVFRAFQSSQPRLCAQPRLPTVHRGDGGDISMSDFIYVGSELDLFAAVHHWKSYWSSAIRRFVTGDLLEAGAGIGSNTAYLDNDDLKRFVCMEPDRHLIGQLEDQLKGKPRKYETVCGTLESLPA